MVRNLSTVQKTQVRSLGLEDSLEKGMTPLPPKNSMDRGAWWATVHGVTKSQTQLSNFARIHSGMHKPFGLPRWFNGKEATYQCRRLGFSPLEEEVATQVQYPCLENPMDREAWQATVQRAANSWTRLSD